MQIDAQSLVQILGAIALILTAGASFVAAISSLRNGKLATQLQTDVSTNTKMTTATNEKVDRITLDVDGRFSATQAQLSRVIEHVIAINPDMIARAAIAAKDVLQTAVDARMDARTALITDAGPVDVQVVPGNVPIPVEVVKQASQ